MEKIVEYWDEEKTKIKSEYFVNENGRLEGVLKGYYENRTLEYEGNYKNGKRNGDWKEYYHNGRLEYEGNYEDGNCKYEAYYNPLGKRLKTQ